MIVVAQCLRHRIVDGKGAGAIDPLRSSSQIAPPRASPLPLNEGQRCLGGLEAKLGRCVGISHDAQQVIERGYVRVRCSGGECCTPDCCFLVWRTASASAAPCAWCSASWTRSFPKALLLGPRTR